MDRINLESCYKALVGVFVAFVLIFQAVISLGPIVGAEIGTRYWPLVNYAMYSRSFREDSVVEIYRLLEGVTENGDLVDIPMDSLGLSLWHYRDLVRDIENSKPEAIAYVRSKVPSASPLTELRIKSFPVIVTRNGPQDRPSEVLVSVRLDPVEDES